MTFTRSDKRIGAMAPRIELIGKERNGLLIVDGASRRTEDLRHAARNAAFSASGSPYYPGVRAPAPEAYARSLAKALTGPLCEIIGREGVFVPVASTFSLVTTRPKDLVFLQRLPHFDGTDPDIVAVLHYLCDEDMGGTAFFRHKTTGFERVTADRLPRFDSALRADIARHGQPEARYHRGSDLIYEEVAAVNASRGRLIAYGGNLLHSGQIPDDFSFSADPADGRLTVNTFLRRIPDGSG